MYQDVHCHFQDVQGKTLAELMRNAGTANVSRLFLNATRPSDWTYVADAARQFPQIVPFFGVHPWYVNELPAQWEEELRAHVRSGGAGIGELGLDKGPRAGDFAVQVDVFSRQLVIAVEYQRPVVIHCVKAWDDMCSIIKQFPAFAAIPVVLHSFMGSREMAEQLAGLKVYFSFTPRLLATDNKKLRSVFSRLPAERVLLESDYPYVPPQCAGFEYGQIMRQLYREAAALRGLDETTFQQQVWDNGSACANATLDR